MKRSIVVLVCMILSALLTACAGTNVTPLPTPPPTSLPRPSVTPGSPAAPLTSSAVPSALPPGTGTPAPIKISGVETEALANGEIRTTARASAEGDLGVGQIEVASPDKMAVGDTRTIRFRVSPATQLVSSTPIAVLPAGKTPDLPSFVYRFSGNVQLYPVMFAELRAVTFTVLPVGPQRRDIKSADTVEWSWLVNAKTAGQQDLSISLAIPAIVNGSPTEISTTPLQEVPLSIQVSQPGPPVTPTPDSLWNRAMKSIAENSGAIVIALIGLAGTIIGIIYKMRSDSKESKK